MEWAVMGSSFKRLASLAAVITLTAVTAACGSDAAGDGSTADGGSGDLPVKVMMYPNQSYRLQAVVAQDQGMFEDEGLSVEFVDQPATLGPFQALQATGAHLTPLSPGTVLESWQAGAEMKVACGAMSRLLLSVLAPADTDLATVDEGADWQDALAQLEGKVVGMPVPQGTGNHKLFENLLAEAGVNPADVTFVNIGGATPQVDAALKNQQVDVAVTYPTGTQYLVESGTAVPVMYLPESNSGLSDIYGSMWTGNPEWIDSHPEEVRAFCAAVDFASQFIQDDAKADTLVPIMTEDMALTDPVARRVLDDGVSDVYTTEVTQEQWDQTLQAHIDAGVIESSPVPTYDELFADAG
jgi:NitT/TauT family transport system substrate-binding protein